MKKMIVAAVVCAASLTGCAGAYSPMGNADMWTINARFGNGMVQSQDSRNVAFVGDAEDGGDLIGFLRHDQKCTGFSARVKRDAPIEINGISVRMNKQCANKNLVGVFPATGEGRDLLYRMFANTKNRNVVIGSDTYTTRGFHKVLRKLHDNRNAI